MAIDLDVHGNTKPLEAAVQAAVNRIRRQPIKITIDDKGATQPLGNMKRGADEFTKSMEAANARILAFGASMAIINGVGNAFKGMVKNLVEVEKSLADINVVMGLSAQNLDKFSDGLFKVAKETGAAFRVAADAATEYARQGLSVEESLKRTRDALVLTRLTGMDSAEAVKSLTAAMNTYGNQIKDTTQLVSKFAAVDVKFAVSAEDFADAISRTGQSAKSAGVDIDELIGIVTSAQQQTARGGAVIGNALKTIFTKTGKTDTLNQLENLGIAVRDLEGNTLGAKRILSDLANTFDKLSEAQKAQITQTMGGLFHINILKAVLSDAAKQNGIMAEATRISAGATDEAIQKNEELRKTMSAVATETGLAIKQVSAQIGEIALAPGMEKILNTVKSLAEGLSGVLGDGESTGSSFATGFLKGIGNVITGPGLVVLAGVFFKLFGQALKFTKESLTSLVGVTTEQQKQKAIQTSLVALFGQNAALNKEMLRTDIGRTEKEKIILGLLKAQVVEANALNRLTAGMAGTLYRKGYGANLTPIGKKASGHIPNFANPERAQAARGGYAAGSIRSMNMPGEGPVIYNSAETVKNFAGFKQPAIMPPQSSKAGKNYQQAFGDIHGFDPYAAGGYIPNYAARGGKGASKGAGARPRIDLSNPAIMQEIDEKTKYLNAGSNKYIGLSASLGPDSPKQTFYVAGGSGTDSGIYNQKGRSFYKNAAMQRAQPRKIDVEFKSLDEKDERRGFQRYDDEINQELQEKSKAIVNGILGTFKQPPMLDSNVEKDLPKSKMATVAGHIFEAVTKSVLRSVGAEAAIPDKENELIDLLPNKELYELFDVDKGKGSSGAEAKINTNLKNVMAFARKIYSSDPTTKTPLDLKSLPKKGKAYGHIPNFADPLSDAIGREKAAGVPVSQIRVGSHGALMNKSNPLGLGVTNTHDEPNGLRDVFGANGFVPNYAVGDFILGTKGSTFEFLDKEIKSLTKDLAKYQKTIINLEIESARGKDVQQQLNDAHKKLANTEQQLTTATEWHKEELEKTKGKSRSGGLIGGYQSLTSGYSSWNKRFESTGIGKALGSTGGQMALMMGLPIAGSFIGNAVGGQTGVGINSAFSGAATGASMGMIFGPLGIAIGTTAGALFGLVDATKKATEAQEEAAKKRSQELTGMGAEVSQALASFKVFNIKDAPSMKGFNLTPQDYTKQITKLQERSSVGKFFNLMKGQEVDTKKAYTYRGIAPEKAQKAALDYIAKEYGAESEEYSTLAPEIEKIISGKGSEKLYTAGMIFDDAIKGRVSQLNKLFKGIDEAVERETIIKNLESMPGDFTFKGKKVLTKTESEALSKAGKAVPLEDYTGATLAQDLKKLSAEEFAAYKEGAKQGQKAYQDSLKEQARGVIIQLNLQKAQIQAQRNAADAQLDIKSKYLQQSNMLEMQEKLMGGLMTEQQKAQLKYNQSINKAAEAFDQAEATANAMLKTGILQQVGSSDTLQQALKKSIGSQFKVGSKDLVRDISDKVAGMSADELVNTLKNIQKENKGNADIQQAINLLMETELQKRQNSVDLAQRQKDIAEGQASSELKINSILADRRQIISDLERDSRMGGEQIRHDQKMRGLASQLGIAQRLTNVGPGYQTRAQQEDFQINEKRIAMEDQVKTLEENRQQALKQQEIEKAKIVDVDVAELQLLHDKEGKTDAEYKRMQELEILLVERGKKLAEIEQKTNNINKETEEEISNAKKLLALEEKRLAAKRAHETGPGAFRNGMSDAAKSMREQVEYMDYELGKRIPTAFADGLAGAMTAAINGTKSIKEGLTDAAISFLGMIQQAMLQKAAMQVVGAMGFSRGGNVRKYSQGGGVPAMVTNGEYVMGRDAVNKYGGAFMHGMNAGGSIPGFSNGGPAPGSALAANFGGGRGYASGRAYQSRAMSGFFYSQSGNVGLGEDRESLLGVLAEEERQRQAAAAKKAKKKALWKQLLGTVASVGISHVLGGAFGGGTNVGKDLGAVTDEFGNVNNFGKQLGYTSGNRLYPSATDVPAGVRFGLDKYGQPISILPKYQGGPIRKYASGGHIAGKSGIDQIPAMLSEGEYVIRASSARQIGRPMLDRINAGKFNDGGPVSEIAGSSETGSTGGNTNNINISINMERGAKSEKKSSESGGTNPADKSQEEQDNAALAERIKQQVVSVIVEEQRPGGLLDDKS